MMKKTLILILVFSPLIAAAQDYTQGPPPGYAGTQPPTQEQIQQMMKQGQPGTQPPADFQGLMPIQAPGTMAPPSFDMSKLNLPPMPGMPENGPMPMFMGKPLAGDGVSEMAGRLGEALDQIGAKLLEGEDGLGQLKDGQVKLGEAETAMKAARAAYNAAREAYAAGDYMKAGEKLQAMQQANFGEKFSKLEQGGITADLINDVRAKMKDGLKGLAGAPDDGDTVEIRAKLLAGLESLDQAQALLRSGDKKGAAKIMAELRKMSPEGEAGEQAGQFGKMSGKMIKKILDQIAAGLAKADAGLAEAKKSGVEPGAEELALLEQGKAIYAEAQLLFDKGDFAGAGAKLKELQGLDLQEKFMAFRDRVLPPGRLEQIMNDLVNGTRALEITISHAKDFGLDTAPLEEHLAKLRDLRDKAQAAFDAKNFDLFLTIAGQARDLKTREAVDTFIRKMANERIKEMVKEGLAKANEAITLLETAISQMTNADNANKLLSDIKAELIKAQSFFDEGNYMDAGRTLDEAVKELIALRNNLLDSGIKLSDEQTAAVNEVMSAGQSGEDMANLSGEQSAKAQAMLGKVNPGDLNQIKTSLMNFNPELLDKVITSRERDKNFIDKIMRDVVPLVPEEDRAAMLEGKMNLLDEVKSADNTIAAVKKLKGVAKGTPALLDQLKNQIKGYNFTSKIAGKLDAKFSDFNDKLQGGEMTNGKQVDNYVKVMADEVKRAVAAANAEKFKEGVLPARNIDDNNPLFEEVRQLKDDGALAPDKKGNIDLGKKLDKTFLAGMINKTVDENAIKPAAGKATMMDVIKSAAAAYDLRTPADPAGAVAFAAKLGVTLKPADLKKQATLGQAIDLVANADDRWGAN